MKTYKNILLAIAFLILMSGTTFGIGKTSARSGDFYTASTWTDNVKPVAGDDIVIKAEHGVWNAHGTIGILIVEGTLQIKSGFTLTAKKNLTVRETGIIQTGSLNLLGASARNDGKIASYALFNGDVEQIISGQGTWNSGGEFNGTKLKTIKRLNAKTREWKVTGLVGVEGKWSLTDAKINKYAEGNIFSLVDGNGIAGVIEFEGASRIASNETTGNILNANIYIRSGRLLGESGSISSFVIIENGALFTTPANLTRFRFNGDLNINEGGILGGRGIYFSGANIRNNGLVNPNVLTIDDNGDQNISGGGGWKPVNGFVFEGSGRKSLSNSITIETNASLKLISSLSLNGHTVSLQRCSLVKSKTAKIEGAGTIAFSGGGQLSSDESTGNLFEASVEIVEGTTSVPISSGISGAITVAGGATLNVYPDKALTAKNDVTVKPGGKITGGPLTFNGKNFYNDGNVASWIVNFSEGSHYLRGDGKFSGNTFYLKNSNPPADYITVVSGVQQFVNLTLEGASRLDIRDQTIKIARVLSLPDTGKILTDGSTIEYNSTEPSQTIQTKIDYSFLTINTTGIVRLIQAEKVKNNLRLENGVFAIGTNLLTVCGKTIEINGTLNGTPTNIICEDESAKVTR